MRSFLASIIAIVFLGCGNSPPDEQVVHVETDVPIDQGKGTGGAGGGGGGDGCGGDPVETRLPGVTGEAVALCRTCDHGCELEGEPCDTYGSSCDFFGETGVCVACCDGERGELRCSNID